jgi:hypothetical protein
MKRIMMALVFLVATLGFTNVNAQQKPGAKKTAKTTTVKAKETTTTTTAKTGLKKDGTPDMRLKENKVAAKSKPVGPLKKDGTPDMRYKANKTATTKTATTK